jgi:diguanylate cyclase (GGDEF)-like protein
VVHPSTTDPTLRVLLIVVAGLLTAGLMTKLIAAASVRQVREFGLLNEMGAIAAGAHSLESSLEAFMPLAGALLRAERVVAYWLPPRDATETAGSTGAPVTLSFARWDRNPDLPDLADSTGTESLPVDELWDRPSGAIGQSGRSWVWARAPEGSVVALAVDAEKPRLQTQISWQYAFDRVVPELEALVTLTGFISQLSEMTRTDYLTGLANRRAFMDRLTQEVASVERRKDVLTVAMLDLDHFKDFNDEHGHLLGDQLLRGFASLLATRSRGTDLAARYGGEEFCLVLPNTDTEGAVRLLSDLHTAGRGLREPMGVTFSAGVTSWQPGDDPETLLARADIGLYQAKSAGRDQTAVASVERATDDATSN